jgi:hypothetical protein
VTGDYGSEPLLIYPDQFKQIVSVIIADISRHLAIQRSVQAANTHNQGVAGLQDYLALGESVQPVVGRWMAVGMLLLSSP